MSKILIITLLLLSLSSDALTAEGISGRGATTGYDFGPSLELDELVEAVLAENPELTAAEKMYETARADADASGFWPDPNFSAAFSYLPTNDAGDGGTGMPRIELSLMQEVPVPGKNYYRRKSAEAGAGSAEKEYLQKRITLVKRARDAYYDLYLIERLLDIEERRKVLLEDYARIAEARYAVGEGPIHDAIRGQLEVSVKTGEVLTLGLKRGVAAGKVNILVGREPGTELPSAAGELVLPEIDYPLEELKGIALENNPEISGAEYALERAKAARTLSKVEFVPDVTLAVDYNIQEEVPTDPMAGEDFWTFSIGFDLPVISPFKQRYELAKTRAEVEMNEAKLKDTEYNVLFEVHGLYLELEEYRIKIDLYEDAVLPQAELSLAAALAGYRTGEIDFLTLIDNETMLLEKEIMYYEITVNYCKTAAAIEAAVGTELY